MVYQQILSKKLHDQRQSLFGLVQNSILNYHASKLKFYHTVYSLMKLKN